jgi:hypothetical protein
LDPTERTRLTTHYAGLTDEDLRRAFTAGPTGFRDPDVWAIVEREYELRQLSPITSSRLDEPTAPIVPERPIPWFFMARLRGVRWPLGEPLPFDYLRLVAAVFAVLSLRNAYWLVTGIVDYLGYQLYESDRRFPVLEAVDLVWTALFVAAALSRRRWAWHFLVAAPVVSIVVRAIDVAIWDRTVLAAPWYLLHWLYLARRRPRFGLATWPLVM